MRVEKTSLRRPLTAQLEVTDGCNHMCEHCYNLDSNVINRPNRRVDDSVVLNCADKLIKAGVFSVVVSGGEPLIKKDLTKQIIQKLIDNNIEVHLNTNIVLMDDDFLNFIATKNITVLTSCPSSNPASFTKITRVGKYSLFKQKLLRLIEAKVRVAVNMVVSKTNKHEIWSTAEDLISIGVKAFAATPMGLNVDYPRKDLLLDVEEVKEVIEILISLRERHNIHVDVMEALPKCIFSKEILASDYAFLKRRCQAGRNVISVSCNGDVRPCAHNNDVYGNILLEPIEDIWERMDKWRTNQYVPSDCMGCGYVTRCLGGCRTSSYAYFGKWDSPDIWRQTPLSIVPKKETKLIFKDSDKYIVNKNIVYRKEVEQQYVIYNKEDDRFLMVNESLFSFIRLILDKSTNFECIGDIRNFLCVKEDAEDFQNLMNFLVKNKILRTKTEKLAAEERADQS